MRLSAEQRAADGDAPADECPSECPPLLYIQHPTSCTGIQAKQPRGSARGLSLGAQLIESLTPTTAARCTLEARHVEPHEHDVATGTRFEAILYSSRVHSTIILL